MKNIFLYISLCIALLFVSCSKEGHQEKEFVNHILSERPELSKYTWLVIIPGAGCNGCIQEGEYFLKRHVSEETIYFVLTNISSIKILQHKTGLKLKEYANVYIDRENSFLLPTNNSVYPCVAEIRNGHVYTIKFQSPQTSALRWVEESLLK